jgi:hypothetical protein
MRRSKALFPELYVVPVGGCAEVVGAVRAFRRHQPLHRYHVRGIIDRDDRSPGELEAHQTKGMHALPVAGIENLQIVPEALTAVGSRVGLTGAELADRVRAAKERAVAELRRNRDAMVAQRAQHAVRHVLAQVTRRGTSKQDLLDAVAETVNQADAAARYDEAAALIDSVLEEPDLTKQFEGVLRHYRNKGLVPAAVASLNVSPAVYQRIFLQVLRTVEHPLRESLRQRIAFPE